MALDDTARRALATARLLTVAFALACVMYVLVTPPALAGREAVEAGRRATLVPALLALAAMGLAASFFVGSAIRSRGARDLNAWFVAQLIALALREGAALMGLVLSLLIGAVWPVVACSLAGLAAMALGFPRASDLEAHLRS